MSRDEAVRSLWSRLLEAPIGRDGEIRGWRDYWNRLGEGGQAIADRRERLCCTEIAAKHATGERAERIVGWHVGRLREELRFGVAIGGDGSRWQRQAGGWVPENGPGSPQEAPEWAGESWEPPIRETPSVEA